MDGGVVIACLFAALFLVIFSVTVVLRAKKTKILTNARPVVNGKSTKSDYSLSHSCCSPFQKRLTYCLHPVSDGQRDFSCVYVNAPKIFSNERFTGKTVPYLSLNFFSLGFFVQIGSLLRLSPLSGALHWSPRNQHTFVWPDQVQSDDRPRSPVVSEVECCSTAERLLWSTLQVSVQLWALQNSMGLLLLSRPFFRTTQIIIVPDDQSFQTRTYISPPAPLSEYTIGPALQLDFLFRVLDLQTTVLALQAELTDTNETVSLTDICLKPLAPDNENCTVFSLLQYFQNSRDNLNKSTNDGFFTTADYATHFLACSQAPTTTNDDPLGLSCFGDFGGTINPFMILGNYSDTTYSNATALVITVVIENSNDPVKVQKGSLDSSGIEV